MTATVREFNHRTYGAIGKVVLEADVKTVKLNGKPIPGASVEYLLNFALQSLQDAYAGAKNAAEAKGAFDTKLDRLIAGTIGTRSGSGGVSDETRIARRIVRNAMKTKLGKDSLDWIAFTDLSDDEANARLDEVFAKNEAKLRPIVEAELEELRKERERKAKLAKSSDDLDI